MSISPWEYAVRFKILFMFLVSTLLLACDVNNFTITGVFSTPQKFSKGAPVYFADQEVGSISEIIEVPEGVEVQLTLDKEQAVKINANAALVVNRLKAGSPLEIYNRNTADEQPLISGQKIQGLSSVVELGAWMIGDALQIGTKSVTQYVDAFQEYLQSDKFQQDKSVVQEQVRSATQTTQQVIESVGDGVSEALQELSKSEGTAVQSMEQLGEELSPVVAELAKNGKQIIGQLQELTKNLEESSLQEQAIGTEFLSTLLATLKKLNLSMENEITNDE